MRQMTKGKARPSHVRSGGLIEILEARCLLAVTPASPTISALASTDTAISFAWVSPDGSSVKLEEKGPTDLNYHLYATLGTTSGNYALSNLTPNRQYSLRLRSEIEGVVAYTDASIRTQETVAAPFGDLALPAPVLSGSSYTYSGPQPSSAILYRRWNDRPDFVGGPIWTVLDPVSAYMGTMGQWWTSAAPSGSWDFFGGVGLNYSVKGFTMSGGSTSPWSNAGTFSPSGTPTAAPTNLTATAAVDGGVDLSWSAVQGGTISRYFIMGGNALGTTVDASVAGTVLTYHVDPSVLTNHVWTFTVMAQGGPGAISPMAPPASADRTGAVPAAPTDFRAYLGDGRDKVRLVWDNFPNTESGFHVQIKESTAPDTAWADPWAGGGTIGADVSTKEFTLPANYAGKTYSVRICAYNSGGNSDYAQTTASGVALRSVTFGGTGFQTIMRDSGSAVYGSPQWEDGNLNGTINPAPGVSTYSNGTIDALVPYSDWRFPISYVRTIATESRLSASPNFFYGGSIGSNWEIQGEASGYHFTAVSAQVGGTWVWSTLESCEALPEAISSDTLTIAWELSTDGGQNWIDVGQTQNHLYVTGAAASGAFETVLNLGCEGAKGLAPGGSEDANGNGLLDSGEDANTNGVLDDDKAVVNGVWGKFSGNSTSRVDRTVMTYTHLAGTGIDAADMLKYTEYTNGYGQCTAWADLLVQTLVAQGVTATKADVASDANVNASAFVVQAMPAQGSPRADYTYMGTTRATAFRFHQIVRVSVFPDRLYDPSYGGTADAAGGLSALTIYENKYLTEVWNGTTWAQDVSSEDLLIGSIDWSTGILR